MSTVDPNTVLIQTNEGESHFCFSSERVGTRGRLPVTVLIAAKNEEANIACCLSALAPAERVVVVDSLSDDETAQIVRDAGAEIVQFRYRGGYPKKRQWALDHLDIDTPWVFLLDADEVVPPSLWEEIARTLNSQGGADAYLVTKGFHFLGRRFRFGGFSHSAVLLFRTGRARFENILHDPPVAQDMEVHERLHVDGKIGRLKTPLIHQDFKGLEAFLARHNLYSTWEARVRHRYLQTGRWGEGAVQARLFGNLQEVRRFLKCLTIRVPFEPQLWFFYHYFLRLGFLEGRAGLIASRIRAHYIAQVRAKLCELNLQG
jgi:glycosyltransferase involved in cell wall biosynthesis